ncbi:hypothetical protein EMIT047CA2_230074 [Pseudomonas soli]
MPAAYRTAARRGRAGCGGFKFGGRVDAGGNGLLQLFDRGRRLGGGLAQVNTAVGGVGTPLGVATEVEQTAVGQLQSDRAASAGVYLFTGKQAIAFDQNAPDAFWGNCDDLANNAFDDGNNSAHWTLRTTRSVGFHARPAFEGGD